jgi:hypothetical protein
MRQPSSTDEAIATMLGSTLSGMISRIPCHPLDTIKARIQSGEYSGGKSNVWQAGRTIVRAEGAMALYRGFGVTFWMSAPASCVYFSSYEAAKDAFGGGVMAHLGAGLLAEALSCTLYVPIDVVKERMQVQGGRPRGGGTPYYASARDAFSQILSKEGVRGLYRGYGATLAAFGPFSALYFACYEALRSRALVWDKNSAGGGRGGGSLPLWLQATVAAGAGAVASAATAPLDLVKLRLQTQQILVQPAAVVEGSNSTSSTSSSSSSSNSSQQGRRHTVSIMGGLRDAWAAGGVRGLWAGAGARVLFHSSSTAIALSCFEECRSAARTFLYEQ